MSDDEQSAILKIAPEKTPEIEEHLTTKNAVSTIYNRLIHLEANASKLAEELKFLKDNVKEHLDG